MGRQLSLPAFLFLSALSAVPASAQPSLRVAHHARKLVPGEAVVFAVQCAAPLAEVTGEWLGHHILFAEVQQREWRALAGIDLATAAGNHTLRVSARTVKGRALGARLVLRTRSRAFPTRQVTVPDEFVNIPPSVLPRVDEERAKVETLLAITTPERLWEGRFVAPVPGAATSSFGRRTILNGEPRSPHTGTDFHASTGTPVVAPNRGRIVLAADLYVSGGTLIIDHGQGVYSFLAHLERILVKEGNLVERGTVVAASGATGRVTAPHLHWGVRASGARVDPLSLLAVVR